MRLKRGLGKEAMATWNNFIFNKSIVTILNVTYLRVFEILFVFVGYFAFDRVLYTCLIFYTKPHHKRF